MPLATSGATSCIGQRLCSPTSCGAEHGSRFCQRAVRALFDRIFTRSTGYFVLDRLLARLHRGKAELLRVLEWPEIPLHNNDFKNDIRACVTRRKVSGGTISEDGRTARDVLLGLSFYRYFGDRLRVPGAMPVPPLPDLVRQAAVTA
jgi:hypothetical protein